MKKYIISKLEEINTLVWRDRTLEAKGVINELLKYLDKCDYNEN